MFAPLFSLFKMGENEDEADDDSSEEGSVEETQASAPRVFDRYGFIKEDGIDQMPDVDKDKADKKRNAKENVRNTKWGRMKGKWQRCTTIRKEKLRRRVRKGIPDAARCWAWFKLSGADDFQLLYPDLSVFDVGALDEKIRDEIERDIDRLVL